MPSHYGKSHIFPPRIRRGSNIALVAPAGPIMSQEHIEMARTNVESFGCVPVLGNAAGSRMDYLAGTDADRAADLNWAINSPHIAAIWCLRGGYGSVRTLNALDYHSLASNPKPVIGYSDITALHAAIGKKCGLVTFHGPTAREPLPAVGRAVGRRIFEQLLFEDTPANSEPHVNIQLPYDIPTPNSMRVLKMGTAQGRLAGGNLTVLTSLVGTPYFPNLSDSILVLEDVNEEVYKIDRMFQQLLHSGSLAGVRALVLGQFTWDRPGEDGRRSADSYSVGLDRVVKEIAEHLHIPCVVGLPFGHISEQWTLPLGAWCSLTDGHLGFND